MGRHSEYGKNLAIWIEYTLQQIPGGQRGEYRKRFFKELKKFSFKPRPKGTPPNSGCIHELDDLAEVNIENPEEFARLVKEGIHIMYQKETQKRIYDALLEQL